MIAEPEKRDVATHRLELLTNQLVQYEEFDALPIEEQIFLIFQSVRDSTQMIQLAASQDAQVLNLLEQQETERLAELTGDDTEGLRQRLESLRQIRADGPETLLAQLEESTHLAAEGIQQFADQLVD